MFRHIIHYTAICFALTGCLSDQQLADRAATYQAQALCGQRIGTMTKAQSEKMEDCYQRTYPQFYQTEIQRQSTINQTFWQSQAIINSQ